MPMKRILALIAVLVAAAGTHQGSAANSNDAGADLRAQASGLIGALESLLPGLDVNTVFDVPIPGLVGIETSDGQTLYGNAGW